MFKKFTLACLFAAIAAPSFAHHHTDHKPNAEHVTHGGAIVVNQHLKVEKAYAKATIPGIKVSSGYFSLTNLGDKPLRFVGVETPAVKHTEFHRMFMRDSKMAMRKVDYIEVEPNQTFELTPGGYHLMFMGVQQQLKPNTSLQLTLIEESGQRYDFDMPIVANDKH
ncbi:copper chaperone PCu(A)C [Vibrio sp. LaRot3]|uniref:copper chaperone PCu(A)C n=1 Tax=Vibrio sp. LaRot3 TaxID=2998829 RepID=UPI0022CE0053|nr:copper chaperone PCu(A)C [Vibrio sp. LaRot3]MDA0148101.1 copper chaperone PCu(A)C [Vibrio sp. LaRot3]